eukprot:2032188-Amphidinium_carterae.1
MARKPRNFQSPLLCVFTQIARSSCPRPVRPRQEAHYWCWRTSCAFRGRCFRLPYTNVRKHLVIDPRPLGKQ